MEETTKPEPARGTSDVDVDSLSSRSNCISFLTNFSVRFIQTEPYSAPGLASLLELNTEFAGLSLSQLTESPAWPHPGLPALFELVKRCTGIATLRARGLGRDLNFSCEHLVCTLVDSLETVTLRTLEIRGYRCDQIGDALARLPSLSRFELSCCNIQRLEALLGGYAMSRFGALKQICLKYCFTGDHGATVVAKLLRRARNVQSIRLHQECIAGSGGVVLGKALAGLSRLSGLDLSKNRLKDEGVTGIADGLVKRRFPETLLRLDLSDNGIREAGGVAISRILAVSPFLSSLNLAKNRLGPDSGIAIGHSLATTATRVTDLDISDCNLGPRGIAAVCCSLISVVSLRMEKNAAGDEGAKAVAESIIATGTIVRLEIEENAISEPGARELARGLAANANASGSLRDLRLGGNPIGPGGVGAIFSAMQKAPHRWNEICICSCRAGSRGAEAVARFLSEQTELLTLCMEKNGIKAGGAKAICEALQEGHRCSLNELKLGNNPLGERGAILVAEKIIRNGISVQELGIEGIGMEYGGTMAVAKAIEERCEGSVLRRVKVSGGSGWLEELVALKAAKRKAEPKLEVEIVLGN